MKKYLKRLVAKANDFSIKKKLHMLYIFCVLLPLVITDSVILLMLINADHVSQQHELQNIAEAVKYNLNSSVEAAATVAKDIYTNKYINEFMDEEYASVLDYYVHYLEQIQDSLFKSSIGSSFRITMYADNVTIVNGGEFARVETIVDSEWYKSLKESEKDIAFYVYYDDSKASAFNSKRKISLVRKLNYYRWKSREKVLKIDMDYSSMQRDLINMNYEAPVYICLDGKIIFSNHGVIRPGQDFEAFQEWNDIGYEENFSIYGQGLELYVLKKEGNIQNVLLGNIPVLLLLICVNAFLPWIFVRMLNRSFTERLSDLSAAFDNEEQEKLPQITNIRGQDEIGALMCNYNRMVGRINDLIQTVYIDTLKKQEMDIARQNAELLALHSQINPHFLFNALESIRMHSILKRETETADMVEKLAKMERQYVEWGTDSETIKEEVGFAEAYLELQKYRFGDRLCYQIEVDKQCEEIKIPKLTLLTFVENACVHGIENKSTTGWIFVRIYPKQNDLYLEIEDTGDGIEEQQLLELREKMNGASIRDLKEKGRVGMINACLRLKMATNNEVRFELDSEKGIGTIVTVKVPLKYSNWETVTED